MINKTTQLAGQLATTLVESLQDNLDWAIDNSETRDLEGEAYRKYRNKLAIQVLKEATKILKTNYGRT